MLTGHHILYTGVDSVAITASPFFSYDGSDLSWSGGTIGLTGSGTGTINSVIRFGDGTEYIQIDKTKALTLAGDTTVWDDLRIALEAVKLTGSKSPSYERVLNDSAESTGVYAYKFSGTTVNEVFFSAQLPHDYKQGSDIYPHVHFLPVDGNSGNVEFQLEYTWANYTDDFGATNTKTGYEATGERTNQHLICSLESIAGTNKTISSVLLCRLYRDPESANDSYGSAVFVLEVDFHYQRDSLGSYEEFSK